MNVPLQQDPAADVALNRLRNVALAVGVGGAVLSALGLFADREQFYRSYLTAYLFVVGMPLGCLAFLLIHHLTGGRWGFVIRRQLEAATRTILPMAVLFVPVVAGMKDLYIWSRPEVVAADELLQHKAAYLNATFFVARAAFFFATWIGLSLVLGRLTRRLDEGVDAALSRRFRVVGGLGIAIYGLTVTFASIDWGMSLSPHWFSTMYGPLTGVGQLLSGLTLCIVLAAWLRRYRPVSDVMRPDQVNDLGNFTLTFVMLWAYLAFSQFLIIWSANVREEVPWYAVRLGMQWKSVGIALLVLHFAVPFLFLLSRGIKRNLTILSRIAAGLLVMRFVDIFWTIAPVFHPESLRVHWLDFTLVLALGGLWLAFLATQLRKATLIAPHDTRVAAWAAKEAHGHA